MVTSPLWLMFGLAISSACCYAQIGTVRAAKPDRSITFDSTRDAVIPQVVDGGGWQTSIILLNPGSKPLDAIIGFFGDSGKLVELPIRQLNNSRHSILTGPIPAGGSITIDTADLDSTTVQGYAIVAAMDPTSMLTGLAVFRQRVSGRPDFEAVVPISPYDEVEFAMPFDNRNGFSTGIAIANPDDGEGAPSSTLTFQFNDPDGKLISTQTLSMAATTHTAFSIPAQWPSLSGRNGTVIVRSTGRQLSALGLRFNPGGAFTSFHALSLPRTTNAPTPPASTPPTLPGTGSTCNSLLGLYIFAQDGTYLGKISANKYEQDSISNQYGTYGSSYSSTSIFNRYGQYGSDYSSLSPFSTYGSQPPLLVSGSSSLAYLTVNTSKIPRVDTFFVLGCVGRSR